MIGPSHGPVNFAGVRLQGATYESPIDVSAGFEQVACGCGGHMRSRDDIPESDARQRVRYSRLGGIQIQVAGNDNGLTRIATAGIL